MEKKEKMLNAQELESVSGGTGFVDLTYSGIVQSVDKTMNTYWVYVPRTNETYAAYIPSNETATIKVNAKVIISYDDRYNKWFIRIFPQRKK